MCPLDAHIKGKYVEVDIQNNPNEQPSVRCYGKLGIALHRCKGEACPQIISQAPENTEG